jgi:hypothetical protein
MKLVVIITNKNRKDMGLSIPPVVYKMPLTRKRLPTTCEEALNARGKNFKRSACISEKKKPIPITTHRGPIGAVISRRS